MCFHTFYLQMEQLNLGKGVGGGGGGLMKSFIVPSAGERGTSDEAGCLLQYHNQLINQPSNFLFKRSGDF